LFFDRGFYHGHVPILAGKQIGYLVAGPLMQLANLRQILEGYAECEQANLVDIVTDECNSSQELDQILESFAGRLIDKAVAGYVRPPTFLSVGGSKIFRDAIWASLRVVFQADHKYYRSHRLYDFPRRSLKTRITDRILTWLTKIPSFRREFLKRMKKEMIVPLEKVLEKEDGEGN
jgi:hypothetical protein